MAVAMEDRRGHIWAFWTDKTDRQRSVGPSALLRGARDANMGLNGY